MRADARRNVDLLVAAAREAFAAHGPDASLDDIARSAGVGSGTLYRHFPTRLALLEAVYRDNVERLAAEGDRLRATLPPGDALVAWLGAFVGYVAIKRGLANALTSGLGNDADIFAQSHAVMVRTGSALLADAQAVGAIRPDVALMDLLRLAGAIGAAAENSPEGPALSERLLRIAIDGVRPGRPEA
jgi:AcrR family transcriptional regulator